MNLQVHYSIRGGERHAYVTDVDTHPGETTCPFGRNHTGALRRDDHSAAFRPGKTTGDIHLNVDCPCDIECPKCGSGVGRDCQTATGWPSKWHAARVKASPRCREILDGKRSRCDAPLFDHDYEIVEDAEPVLIGAVAHGTAACRFCGSTGHYPLREPGDPADQGRIELSGTEEG